ncbi:efflux RND transporter periplasmic adaptor subunit [Marivirga sp. S37H4]|uniref:Efflux RND transporter periplasmic adaptor subunit n=1 Tax=Marivirga aurantiaca TaxID=2802615 RepID=A0A934WWN3_9BACT|nr:efflux RND transporter periplasmic adaptor subunit [Marivirga aurantiaca]MBK6264292.1 efflux RND transporter periplasmic adaptor subunit [Marivirga aurantiaca]
MTIKNTIYGLLLIGFLGACESESDTEELKSRLEELKQEIQERNAEISEIQKELAEKDPQFADEMDKSVLVRTTEVDKGYFQHKIQVQGEVASRKNIDMSAETMGRVIQVNVEPGDIVKRGQTLIRLDASTQQNTLKELQTSLELATNMFEKQEKLWEQEIGSEVQYLEAKNRKEALERQIETVKSQLDMSYIKAPFNGRVNSVDVRMGELAQPGVPIITIVSNEEMYLKADVSEQYIGDFEAGDPVEVHLPALKESFVSKVSSISYVINPSNRTFQLDVKLTDYVNKVKPNQFARLDLVDYENEDAIIIKSDIIQQDNLGDFVYVVETQDGVKVARKVPIKRGMTYGGKTEVLEGLSTDDVIISEGYRDAVDGITVKVAN